MSKLVCFVQALNADQRGPLSIRISDGKNELRMVAELNNVTPIVGQQSREYQYDKDDGSPQTVQSLIQWWLDSLRE